MIGWFVFANGWNLTAKIFLAAGIHEAGHLFVLLFYKTPIYGIRIGILGLVLETDTHRLSYGQELLVILAGPAMNLIAVLMGSALQNNSVFVGINMVLFGFNLLPISRLDGGRMLRLILALWMGIEQGEYLSDCISGIVALGLMIGLIYLMCCTGGSLWLIPPVFWLLQEVRLKIWENDEKNILFL